MASILNRIASPSKATHTSKLKYQASMNLRSLLLLTLLPLALSQTIQTQVSCLSDGQCITDRGEDAVCGKLDSSSTANLPVVKGTGEEYIIRINLNAPLADDPNPSTNCEDANGDCGDNIDVQFSANDPRNPNLGGVGCETPAFRKACQKCCVQTDILSRVRSRNRRTRDSSRDNCEIEGGCEDLVIDDDEALGALRSSSRRNCFRERPLGFYRAPRRRFFRRCTQLARTVCGAGLRVCRNFSP